MSPNAPLTNSLKTNSTDLQNQLGRVPEVIAGIDFWLDSMRATDGYAGPVVHWWQDSVYFTGAGLDWRYEGIIHAYLMLFQKTGDKRWLVKAVTAGEDLVSGQLENGHFRNSSFEANPYPGGTPHEAACDLALLRLADELRTLQEPNWGKFFLSAEKNIQDIILGVLWDPKEMVFRNTEWDSSFIPNKAATILEALFAWSFFKGNFANVEEIIIKTLDRICSFQIRGSSLDGAIDQGGSPLRLSGRYFPFFIARCIPALIIGAEKMNQVRYSKAASRAANFLINYQLPDGSFPQVVYRPFFGLFQPVNYGPRWVAASGDILRCLNVILGDENHTVLSKGLQWLLSASLPTGGICTSKDFANRRGSLNQRKLPEFRDLLPVCGWVDKAFRYLVSLLPDHASIPEVIPVETRLDCQFRGKKMIFTETTTSIELSDKDQVVYQWIKGSAWASRYDL
jgi:hypothetical protein